MIKNIKTLEWAQKIAMVLDRGSVGLANDMYVEMLKQQPMCKWEQIAFGDTVRSFRKSCKVFINKTEHETTYRLEFHGKHIGYFHNEEDLNKKINQLYF